MDYQSFFSGLFPRGKMKSTRSLYGDFIFRIIALFRGHFAAGCFGRPRELKESWGRYFCLSREVFEVFVVRKLTQFLTTP